jgi:hypothetical protein
MVGVVGAAKPLPVTLPLPEKPTFPFTVQVVHRDNPHETFPLWRINSKTKRPNFLQAAQVELAFCTALVARSPSQTLTFLRSFYWNVNWQNTFKTLTPPGTLVVEKVAAGTSCHVGHVLMGRPDDARFTTVLTTPQATNCQSIGLAAFNSPNVTEAAEWRQFDVRF